MQQLKDIGYLRIFWDPASKSQINEWPGGYVGDNIRAGLDIALDEFVKLRARHGEVNWVGDTRQLGVINSTNQSWIDTDWYPRLLATGVKYMAVVVPTSVISRVAVEKIVAKVQGTNLTTRYCVDVEDACRWLTEVKV